MKTNSKQDVRWQSQKDAYMILIGNKCDLQRAVSFSEVPLTLEFYVFIFLLVL